MGQPHGGAQHIAVWEHVRAGRLFDEGQRCHISAHHQRTRYDLDHFQQIMKDHPLPRRWKPSHSDRVRLLCNASSFIEQLTPLHPPRGSFMAFSQAG